MGRGTIIQGCLSTFRDPSHLTGGDRALRNLLYQIRESPDVHGISLSN